LQRPESFPAANCHEGIKMPKVIMKYLFNMFMFVIIFAGTSHADNLLQTIVTEMQDYDDFRGSPPPAIILDKSNNLHILYTTFPGHHYRYLRYNVLTNKKVVEYNVSPSMLSSESQLHVSENSVAYIFFESEGCIGKTCIIGPKKDAVLCFCPPGANASIFSGCILPENRYMYFSWSDWGPFRIINQYGEVESLNDWIGTFSSGQSLFHLSGKEDNINGLIYYVYTGEGREKRPENIIAIEEVDLAVDTELNNVFIDIKNERNVLMTDLYYDGKFRVYENQDGTITIYAGYWDDDPKQKKMCMFKLDSGLNLLPLNPIIAKKQEDYIRLNKNEINNQIFIFEKYKGGERDYAGHIWRYIVTDDAIYYSQSEPVPSNVADINK
jgi:hypothetical protein